MSTAVPAQPPGQPQSKASPIAQLTTAQAAQADDEVVAKSSQASDSRVKSSRAVREPNSNDAVSISSTVTLIQRVLAPNKLVTTETHADVPTIEDILPPLTSSNDVDLELYAILAVIVKDFVNTWYSRITPDNAFVEEIVQIIAHCSRALEQRLRQTDIPSLLFDEIPLLVQTHVEGKGLGNLSKTLLTLPKHIEPLNHTPTTLQTVTHYATYIMNYAHIQPSRRYR